jgi:hypothetical protein
MELPKARIADLPEAGDFAGRYGLQCGVSIPSTSDVGPVVGGNVDGSARQDFAVAVTFPDTQETHWFAPHLVEVID